MFAISALASRAVCVAVDTGLFASVALSTLPSPTMDLVMPVIVPVNVGSIILALFDCNTPRAIAVAVDTDLSKSAVLSTFPSPIVALVIIPEVVPNISGSQTEPLDRGLSAIRPRRLSIPVILLPIATGPFKQARPFMVVVPLRTALNDSALRPKSPTLYSTGLFWRKEHRQTYTH